MENNLYRIEVIAYDNIPKIDTMGMLMTNDGIAFVKLHPVKLKAQPKREVSQGRWIESTNTIYDEPEFICSECGAMWLKFAPPYCSRCGSKMSRGEQK